MKSIFKIRASGSGQIMTNPQKKEALISKTTESFVYDWLKESIYGVKKEIKTKYTDKGLMYENTAIDKAIEWLDLQFILKNEQFFEDDFFTGTPDLISEDRIYDIKCSWSCFTFPLFNDVIPDINYMYQVQVYMHLTGRKKASVVYILLNTPEEMHWETQYNYDSIDKKYKIKVYDFDYDENIIKDLKNRVENIRNFIKKLDI